MYNSLPQVIENTRYDNPLLFADVPMTDVFLSRYLYVRVSQPRGCDHLDYGSYKLKIIKFRKKNYKINLFINKKKYVLKLTIKLEYTLKNE